MVPWRKSVAARYAAVAIAVAIVPLVGVGALYDRFASNLVQTITGEQLQRRLSAISSRLRAFIDARTFQIETLSAYPAMVSLLKSAKPAVVDTSLAAVVQFEADQPDLYGILLFSGAGKLIRAIPGPAASGAPYWQGETFDLAALPRVKIAGAELVGPIQPAPDRPGAFLIVRDLPGGPPGAEPAGRIALHIRLASLTELLGADDESQFVRAVLRAADGKVYSNIGLSTDPTTRAIEGAEIAPGWRPMLIVESDRIAAPLDRVRYLLFAGVAGLALALPWFLIVISRSVRKRISGLVHGVDRAAAGNLSWRIAAKGDDEIDVLARAFNTMAERLQQLIRSMIDVEKMAVLGRFASGVAHEVRNPLAAMKASVQALELHEPDRERLSILNGLREEIDRLDETIEDLLSFARPRDPNFEAVPVAELFRRVAGLTRQPPHDRRISLNCAVSPGLLARADRGQAQQILMNLVLNAIDAMPQGGVLTLRGAIDGERALIEVEDTGEGMTPEVMARVADPFFTTRPGGTGLGLAISRQLAEVNQGSLTFSSTPGRGTVARLHLQLAT